MMSPSDTPRTVRVGVIGVGQIGKNMLVLEYDGTDYAGWQVQPGQRTIQGCLEQALSSLQAGEAVRVRGAGRTGLG